MFLQVKTQLPLSQLQLPIYEKLESLKMTHPNASTTIFDGVFIQMY